MEVKRVINILKDESSDHLSVLEDLNVLWEKSLIFYIFIKTEYKKIYVCICLKLIIN